MRLPAGGARGSASRTVPSTMKSNTSLSLTSPSCFCALRHAILHQLTDSNDSSDSIPYETWPGSEGFSSVSMSRISTVGTARYRYMPAIHSVIRLVLDESYVWSAGSSNLQIVDPRYQCHEHWMLGRPSFVEAIPRRVPLVQLSSVQAIKRASERSSSQ